MAVFSLFSSFCGSAKHKKILRQGKTIARTNKRLISKMNSNISGKARAVVKIVSWRKMKAEAEEEEEEQDQDIVDEAVWRKRIIRGERCRPLDFSGRIEYDSEGNLLPSSSSTSR